MKLIYPSIILMLMTFSLKGQEVLWASQVVGYSSQYDVQFYSAKQVLGPPNAMENFSDSPFSWAGATSENEKGEYLHVRYEKPIYVEQFAIAESLNPGAIDRVFLEDTEGQFHLVYEKKSFRPIYSYQRFFSKRIEKTPYKVIGLKVEMNTASIKGMNQIDAIGISDSRKKIKLIVNEIEYSSIVPFPENLGEMVNSEYDERLPIISPDGKTLYFTRKDHPDNIGEEKNDDVWFSTLLKDGTWSKAQNIGQPINNEKHNFVVAVGQAGQLLFLQNAYRKWGTKDGIALASWTGSSWDKPRPMKIRDMYNLNEFAGYFISPDGKILLMAIEREDSYGDRDLYVSFRTSDGDWSAPKNLGKTVNTVGMESSVFLAADNKTLYFSSAGHIGFGGLDMYMTKRLDDSWENWSEPKNLGPYLNTPGNDFNYTLPASGNYAYFSSDFKGFGQADLYRIQLPKEAQPEPVMMVTGRLIDSETHEPIEEDVHQIIIPKDEIKIEEGYVLIPEIEEIEKELDGIETQGIKLDPSKTGGYESIKKDILKIPLKKGQIIPLQNLFFEANKAVLKEISHKELDKIAHFLSKNNQLIVEIGGHTNGFCSDEFAEELSESRAAFVADYLIQKGVAAKQVSYKGYGKSKPIDTNETTAGRRKNQRVELRILEVL